MGTAVRTISVALEMKLAGFTSGLRKAKQEVKGFGDDLASQAKKNKGHWDTVGNTLGGVGLAAAAGVGLAVKKFADFDKAMSNVKAATHETAGNMEELRQAAIKAGKDTAFSATEAAQGIENLAKAGVSTKDILGGGLKGALDLAAAGELGVADAAETAATAMTQFKLKGTDVPHIADLLAAAAGKAQGEVSDMAMGLKQGGLVAAQMGLSIEETTGTLAAFASAGLIGSDAGTSLKTMLLQLANPSEKAAGLMKELNLNVYDSQGAFMGVAPLAEQLKVKLGNLSAEQRNSALATIFGSDAIRAASVLYSQGAAGIADWTTKVNDQGFAAETAAIKTDNLKGDIERLGGSIDTALIQQGSGANDSLRAMAQGAGLLVDGIGNLPDVVPKIGLALGGIAAAGGLGAAGLLKAASAASEARDAWQNLGSVGKRLTLSMGAVGVAITAGLILYGAFSKKNAEAAQKANDLRDTLDEQTGAITQNTRSYVANELAQNGLAEKAKSLGLNLSTVTDAALGNEDALKALVAQLDATIDSGTKVEFQGRATGGTLSKEAVAAQELKRELTGTNEALTTAQEKHKLAAEGAVEHKDAQTLQAEAVKKANEQIKKESESLDDLIDKMQAASTEALSLSDAQIDYQEALAKANEAIDANGKTVDKRTGKIRLDTKEGRENQKTLNDLAKATNDQTESMVRGGTANETTRKTAEAARRTFVSVAMQMGLNKTEAEKLSRSYIDIPAKVNTAVTNSAAAAKRAAEDYRTNGLGKIPKRAPTSVSIENIHQSEKQVGDFAVHVSQTLQGIKDEAIRINLAYTSSLGQNPLNQKMVGRATGGPVFGAGTTTSDSIPAWLSNDEHVLTAKEVQAFGGHGAVKKMRQEALNGYRDGGEVHLGLRTKTPSTGAIDEVAGRTVDLFGRMIAKKHKEMGAWPGGPGARRKFRGKTLNARTVAMLLAAEKMLGAQFHITQGSYSTAVAASGGTHAGGGVMDTDGPRGWNTAVGALRRVGFAAWHRTPAQGPWGHHIHSVAIGDPSASRAAKNQVADYKRGGDGLGSLSSGLGKNPLNNKMSTGGAVKPLLFDAGGMLPTGPSFVYNGTGQPEPVRNASQEASLGRDLSPATIAALAAGNKKAFASALAEGKFRLIPSGGAYVLQRTNG
jgi:TP901 family phage tail tape measure protein